MKIKQLVGTIIAGLTLVTSLSAGAIEISYAQYGVGAWTPANEFNSDNWIMTGVNRSVDIWNGNAPQGLYTVNNESATFTEGSGTSVPLVLALATSYEDRDESSPFQLDNTGGQYLYLTAKYGNTVQQVFYIGGISDIITVPTSLPNVTGGGLSHIAWLKGPSNNVPDAGATAMLLGFAMTGLAGLSRFIKQ